MPNPAARAATAWPMRPKPTTPSTRAVHVDAVVGVEAAAFPSSGAEIRLGLRRPARGSEDEEEREVGGRVVEHAGRVAHRDAEPVRGGDIDVVVADGDGAHHPQPPGCAGFEHRGVDRIEQQAHDPVVGRSGGDELGVRQSGVAALHHLVTGAGEHLEPALGERPGHQHTRHGVQRSQSNSARKLPVAPPWGEMYVYRHSPRKVGDGETRDLGGPVGRGDAGLGRPARR